MSLLEDLATAASQGLVLGVKILVVCAVVLLGAGWIISDYVQVRTNANEAMRIIRASVAQQQQKGAVPPSGP